MMREAVFCRPKSADLAALPAPLRPILRRVNGAAINALNLLVGSRSMCLHSADGAVAFSCGNAQERCADSGSLIVGFACNEVSGCVVFSPAAAENLVAANGTVVDWNAVPEYLALALLQESADQLSEKLLPGTGAVFRLTGWCSRDDLAAVPYRLDLCIERKEAPLGPFFGQLCTDLGGLQTLAGILAARPVQPLDSAWGSLRIPAVLELGWVDMAWREIAQLRCQDIVLPDGWWRPPGESKACLRLSPRCGISAQCKEDSIETITGVIEMKQDSLASADAFQQTGTALDVQDLADVPVRITFDLGECTLPLHELSSLAAGYQFDLALPPQRTVNLRVNGARIGEGELIDIDGRIGVAITRLLQLRQ